MVIVVSYKVFEITSSHFICFLFIHNLFSAVVGVIPMYVCIVLKMLSTSESRLQATYVAGSVSYVLLISLSLLFQGLQLLVQPPAGSDIQASTGHTPPLHQLML